MSDAFKPHDSHPYNCSESPRCCLGWWSSSLTVIPFVRLPVMLNWLIAGIRAISLLGQRGIIIKISWRSRRAASNASLEREKKMLGMKEQSQWYTIFTHSSQFNPQETCIKLSKHPSIPKQRKTSDINAAISRKRSNTAHIS